MLIKVADCRLIDWCLCVQEYVKLLNGWEVSAQAEMEGLFMYNEIFRNECYMKHGITMRDGDTVGANVGQKPDSLQPLTATLGIPSNPCTSYSACTSLRLKASP